MCLPHILSKKIILSRMIILFTSFIKIHPWSFNEVSIIHLFICNKGTMTAQSKATLNIFHKSHYHSSEIFHQLFVLLQSAILGQHSARLGNTWAGTGELTHAESCVLLYPSLCQFSHTTVFAAPDVGPTPLQVQTSLQHRLPRYVSIQKVSKLQPPLSANPCLAHMHSWQLSASGFNLKQELLNRLQTPILTV